MHKMRISPEIKITKRTRQILDLKNTIKKLKAHDRASITNSNRQEKELANLKGCHCKLTRLRSKKKKKKESEQHLWEPGSRLIYS